MQQNTADWLKMRKNYIGASDAPIIMGDCKFKLKDGRVKTPRVLWEEKLGLLPEEEENSACKYGKMMEEPARKEYEKKTGIFVVPDIVYHSKIKYMMASLDGLSMEKDMAVEIKNANADDHAVARQKRVPQHYKAQVQQQLECLYSLYKIDMMHYFSFHKGEGIVVEVKRDVDYLELLYEKEQKFWACVENLEEPELVDQDFREMGIDWESKAHRLWEVEESIKVDTKLAKQLKDELKNLSEGLNCRAGAYRMVSSTRKGTIDYSLIPELMGKDLECYRKTNSRTWALQKGR